VVTKVNEKSVSIQPVGLDGYPSQRKKWDGSYETAGAFSVKKQPKSNRCIKIARYKV
jgi:hypothetical protein